VWTLTVNYDHSAFLTCDNQRSLLKHIAYTDFPLPEITLYYCNKLILLSSEY
jgi:hypothetical protein